MRDDKPVLLERAADQFFSMLHQFSSIGPSGGFSASVLARVEADGQLWCLRQWPRGTSRPHLQFIHDTLRTSHRHSFTGVPQLAETRDGRTLLQLDGYLFEAQTWVEGGPVAGQQRFGRSVPNAVHPLSVDMLGTIASAVALFHDSTEALKPRHPGEIETLADRRQACELAWNEAYALTAQRAEHQWLADDSRGLITRWLELLPQAATRAEAILNSYTSAAEDASTLCHGDLWATHIFVARSRFTGFVDFEHVCFCSPTLDLAQLILHCGDWGRRTVVIDSYEHVCPLSNDQKAVLPAAALLDLIEEGWWALRMILDSSSAEAASSHLSNLNVLLPSLEAILAEG